LEFKQGAPEFAARTVGELVAEVRRMGAGRLSAVGRDDQEQPVFGIYIVVEPDLIERIETTLTAYDAE
jgi:hypothetical protein